MAAIGNSSFVPDHHPMATALMKAEVLELAQVLDHVEKQFAADFASGLIAESPEKLRHMIDYFGAINGENRFRPARCNAPHINIVIEVDGSLRPCYFLPTSGTLKHKPLHEAINTPDALALRRAYRTGQRPECERCVCPLYKGPRALLSM
jgi:MoaA/NifB/PqqE/SkfB family radical SAM enzyme